jgi:predicted ABC-type transport system involved in lysophospholipase L1 biosynthesis ATPase subunit
VAIAGTAASGLSEQARAQFRSATIGCVFQSFSLIPVMTAQENVMLPLVLRARLTRAGLKAAQAQAAELLARVGLATQVRHYPGRLDAGQCQRVAIARALITRPRLVVADEPTSRLDSSSVRTVMELFAACQREHDTAFVVSTRDQRQLSRANRTLQLADGRLLGVPADTPRRALRVLP